MRLHASCVIMLVSGVFLSACSANEGDTAQSVKTVLTRFDDGNPGWKARMQSLVRIARIGPAAVPALTGALKTGTPSVREFAAQALIMFAEPAARPALEHALKDSKATVRLYAVCALRNLGPLTPVERYEKMTDDPDRNVRATVRSALATKSKPNAEALRKAWAGYDLSKMSTARVGELAPDFTLDSRSGKPVRLSDFRGKTVVIRYLKLDY